MYQLVSIRLFRLLQQRNSGTLGYQYPRPGLSE